MGKIQAAQLERGLGSFPQDDGQSGLLLGPERNTCSLAALRAVAGQEDGSLALGRSLS